MQGESTRQRGTLASAMPASEMRVSAMPASPTTRASARTRGYGTRSRGWGAWSSSRAHDGTDFGFLEGPHWRTDHLVFSDLQASPARIYTYSETSGVSLLLTSADGVNGNATGPRGEHYACAMFGRYFGEVVDGELVSLFDSFEGDRLNAPNDVVVSATGALYFTDPGYGISAPDYELEHHSVYRWDGETLTEVWAGSREQRPNGVGLSPDDAILYLADTADGVLRAFDVQPDGSLANEREFAEAPMADGLTLDEDGNIYVTTSAGVAVFAPDGSSWGTISVPMIPANCGFGGADRRTLFITARTGLYAVQLGIPGIAGR